MLDQSDLTHPSPSCDFGDRPLSPVRAEMARETLRSLLRGRAQEFGLTPAAIDTLVEHSRLVRWRSGHTIFTENDRQRVVRLLVAGAVRLEIDGLRDSPTTLRILPPGHVLGWAPMLGIPGATRFSATAHLDSLVAVADYAVVESVVSRLPYDQASRLARHCGRVLMEIVASKCGVLTAALSVRLQRELATLARDFGQAQDGGHLITIPLTHLQLANLAGATRANVTRALGKARRRSEVRFLAGRWWVAGN